MARKRKGRDLRVAVVDKPAGITSTSVVNKVEMGTGCKKAGHAGTWTLTRLAFWRWL
jgi:tRNA pseudouridine55 synthase